VVFQPLAPNYVAQRKKKIIVIVVPGVEKLLRLDHQILVVLQFLRRDLELFGLIGENIEVNQVVRPGRKFHALIVDARVHRRIDQGVQRGVLELNQVSVL